MYTTTFTKEEVGSALDALERFRQNHQMSVEKAVYTHKQMVEMMAITRSWTLNNPCSDLPYLPVQWVDHISQVENEKAVISTMPPYKKAHWLIDFLIWITVFRG